MASKMRPLDPGNKHNLGDSRLDDRIELEVISFRQENPPQDIGNWLFFPLCPES
jgi:hypothetical protein